MTVPAADMNTLAPWWCPGTRITDEGARQLAEALKGCTELHHLDLSCTCALQPPRSYLCTIAMAWPHVYDLTLALVNALPLSLSPLTPCLPAPLPHAHSLDRALPLALCVSLPCHLLVGTLAHSHKHRQHHWRPRRCGAFKALASMHPLGVPFAGP